ncbi:MAG TPA: hypothetical protein VJ577_08825 [Burkholderiaceae bacterium]|nr:hypothetical protein [Burkholderiaceae bacterium]
MKRSTLSLLLMFASATAAADWNSTPEALVRSFQADYLAWNNIAIDLDTRLGISDSMPKVESEYNTLLRKYTLPNFRREPIAYGSDPSHDPSKERTVSVKIDGDHATVRTEVPDPIYTPIYEYELVKAKGRWYLTQVYLVDEEGRYPGL